MQFQEILQNGHFSTYIWPNYEVFSTYDAEVTYLKSWIDKRLIGWIKL